MKKKHVHTRRTFSRSIILSDYATRRDITPQANNCLRHQQNDKHMKETFNYLQVFTLHLLFPSCPHSHLQSWGLWFHLSDQYHLASPEAGSRSIFIIQAALAQCMKEWWGWSFHQVCRPSSYTALMRHLYISSAFTTVYWLDMWSVHVWQSWLCHSVNNYSLNTKQNSLTSEEELQLLY